MGRVTDDVDAHTVNNGGDNTGSCFVDESIPSETTKASSSTRPRKKRVKESSTTASKPKRQPAATTGRRQGRLANLMKMPVDIFAEIVGHLEPIDLLHLARTTKFIRSILMSKSSKLMWKRARGSLDGFPPCPPDLCEPEYASLVFETRCMICHMNRAQLMDCVLRTRACKAHMPELQCPSFPFILYEFEVEEMYYDVLYSMMPKNQLGYLSRKEVYTIIPKYLSLVGGDEQILNSYVEEMKVRATQIEEHGLQLQNWRSAQAAQRYERKKDAIQGRKESIFQKLRELGYEDVDITLSTDREYNRFLDQPAALTPIIWRRIEPALVKILEARRQRRLDLEKLERKVDRRRDIRLHVERSALKVVELKQHEPFHSDCWQETFPRGACLYNLPSVIPLVETDNPSVTREEWESQETQFLAEARPYQLRTRRFLAAVARNEPASLALQAEETQQDSGGLAESDETDAQLLNHPTALFIVGAYVDPYAYGCYSLAAYPAILSNLDDDDDDDYLFGHLSKITMPKESSSMAEILFQRIQAMDPNMSTMTKLLEMNTGFLCGCCSTPFANPVTWPQLVAHFTDEKLWYEREKCSAATNHRSTSSLPNVPLIDDHETPKVVLLRTKAEQDAQRELVASRVEAESPIMLYECRRCDRRSVHDPISLYSWSTKSELQDHLLTKHGISPEEAEHHMDKWYDDTLHDYDGYGDSDGLEFDDDFFIPFPFNMGYFDPLDPDF